MPVQLELMQGNIKVFQRKSWINKADFEQNQNKRTNKQTNEQTKNKTKQTNFTTLTKYEFKSKRPFLF